MIFCLEITSLKKYETNLAVISMAIPVVEFSRDRYKIRKIFGKKSTYPKKVVALVTQPMLQLRPNCTELRSMDYYHQIFCRF